MEKLKTSSDKDTEIIKKINLKKVIKPIVSVLVMIIFYIAASTFIYERVNTGLQRDCMVGLDRYGDHFYTDGTCNAQAIKKASDFIKTLPQTLQDAINDDWVFLFTKKPSPFITKYMPLMQGAISENSILAGMTINSGRLIYINTTVENEVMFESFVHELGHLISYEYGTMHGSSEFRKLYDKFKYEYNANETYSISTVAEFFAEVCSDYLRNKEKLKEDMPEVHFYMDELLSKDIPDDSIFEKIADRPIAIFRLVWSNLSERF